MDILKIYELVCLSGSADFVIEELLQKYPDTEVLSRSGKNVKFKSKETEINTFRNLYSPLNIIDEKGKNLNLSKREWRKEFVPAGINPS